MPLLTKDLLSLGASEEEISKLAQFQGAQQLFSSVPQILGALYAVEGSTLGGQYIARNRPMTWFAHTVSNGCNKIVAQARILG